ncbi:MAG: hypothetical protein IJ300_02915 [Clostridia bacterium]|nr:hypothetical protein [Clostridia bacterium]
MNKSILGIDLGTSSVKLLLWHPDGQIEKSRASYSEKTPKGWIDAIKEAASDLDISNIMAIGLSSQVGTYIVNDTHVISWDDSVGREELEEIKSKYSKEKFIEEIAMPHPDIISYPIPRLLYIKKHFESIESICQPKDYICERLTGLRVTDQYSLRGLVHTEKCEYSMFFLNEIGIDKSVLPTVVSPFDMVATTSKECEKLFGIPKDIPVFAGLNDFFSSIVGMGIEDGGDMFDITGTSEHIGLICDSLYPDTKMVSGVYLDKFIHYGVTASSGVSLDFAIREFGIDGVDIEESLKNCPPIFTPYLNGERAPIFDQNVKGTFFGLSASCSKKDMAYSVLEGVCFSLYHIYESMGSPKCKSIRVSGGASKNSVLNLLKAELFNTNVYTLSENDTSALGAVQVVASALGINETLNAIAGITEPCGKFRDILIKRYNIYKNLYSSLKKQFKEFSDIRKDLVK